MGEEEVPHFPSTALFPSSPPLSSEEFVQLSLPVESDESSSLLLDLTPLDLNMLIAKSFARASFHRLFAFCTCSSSLANSIACSCTFAYSARVFRCIAAAQEVRRLSFSTSRQKVAHTWNVITSLPRLSLGPWLPLSGLQGGTWGWVTAGRQCVRWEK